ncbi:MAG: single-stranded DNA-binding protein [Flavobacteriales bacterium]
MAGVNKVILIGNVGKDPEIRNLDNGVKVANFPLATTEIYKKDGNRMEQTEWHSIVLWRGLAEVAEKIVRKGSQVYIEGKLRTRSWEDKDKVKRYSTEVVAEVLTMLGQKKDDSHNHTASMEDVIGIQANNVDDDDGNILPF